ncbi:cysteine desulfurase [Gracilibacillus oryzae]|uniref:Cysteine desulfurase n=1 Tax=Gracilibacillus oryzae TaxID=1672701 RepID=A0A7C8GUK7_9BACI|nr:cysteine desulfurase family protein [Gracilibacillus oryzae]KAB8138305.1 cysteine desulfurase [Gracilibacillus oryzae]
MIYLDNSATTKPDKAVLDSFHQVATQYFGNPSSIHGLGMDSERLLRKAREKASALLEVDSPEIIFTSGGTEGNNIALKGIALAHQNRGKHIITTSVEHPSVMEACEGLERLGFEVTYLPVDQEGRVSVDDIKFAITYETILVSVMHVNNEIGTIQPISEIGQLLSNYPKIFYHVDNVQGFAKVPLNIREANIDLCTISGHKIHGLKGTGLLYVKTGVKLFSLAHGGGQEANLRSGTENVPGIVGMVKAMRLAKERQAEINNLAELKQYVMDELSKMRHIELNTPKNGSAPHIVHFSAPGLKPEVVIHALEERNIFISTKSACSSKSADESQVLVSCGRSYEIASSGLRVSMSYETTKAEIDVFLKELTKVLDKLSKVMR